MKQLVLCILFFTSLPLLAQKKQFVSLSFTDNATSYPFGMLAGYFKNPVHPGFEAGWGKLFREKKTHDWFGEVKLGYFYHRFLQHGIPVYANYGYRYKISKHFEAATTIGAGYIHSIPAVAVLKKDDNGNYQSAKGIGRPQVIAAFTLGVGYKLMLQQKQPVTVFLQYQARVQTPFVKSYVPVLPYNQLAFGASIQLHPKKS